MLAIDRQAQELKLSTKTMQKTVKKFKLHIVESDKDLKEL